MSHEISLKEAMSRWHGSLKEYLFGFLGSFILSSASFLLVIYKPFQEHLLISLVIALALIQAAFQLVFFLHLGHRDKEKWEKVIFYFMLLILLIVVLGSLWIIFDLNARVMPEMT